MQGAEHQVHVHGRDATGVPDLSCFRLVAHAGAPCPEHLKRRLIELFPPGSTWEFYGSTEGQFTACRSEEWLERPGTLGRARPWRRMYADPDGTLWCVVPPYARFTYFNDPEKRAAAWREGADGPAFTVGDLRRVDEGRRGRVRLPRRPPRGPRDQRRRQRLPGRGRGSSRRGAWCRGRRGLRPARRALGPAGVAAYVGSADPASLDGWARERLAPAKRPKEYHRLDALPRTPTGKVRRLDLPDLVYESRRPGHPRG